MTKKKSLTGIFIAIAIVIAAVIIAPNLKFNFTTINPETINNLNTAPTGQCSASLSQTTITAGQSVTGTINNGANTYCEVYGTDGTSWRVVGTGTTNSQGILSITETISTAGAYTFRAICGTCITNPVTLTVNSLTEPCVDSDGDDRDTPGHVTYAGEMYYDKCLDVGEAVTEYICDGGHAAAKNWACDYGEECIQTRSGGYCRKRTPTYNVGDIVYDSGNLGFDFPAGTVGMSHPIDLGSLPATTELGGCKLQARISTEWGYITPSLCSGLQGNEGMRFSFYDSSGKVWERIDTTPVALSSLTKCGLLWDRQNMWSFQANKLLNLPQCAIGLDYKIAIVICEC